MIFHKNLQEVSRVLLAALLISLCALPLTGCGNGEEETEPDESAEQQLPPTTDELVREAVQRLQILNVIPRGVPLQFLISDEGRGRLLQYVREWKNQSLQTPEGEEAVDQLVTDLEQRIQVAKEAENAGVVLMLADILDVLGTKRGIVDMYRQWAEVMNNRPVVDLRAFYAERDESVDPPRRIVEAVVDVYVPETNEWHRGERIREGEEFFGLEFESVIGDMRGMELRYLATNDTYEVYKDAASARGR
jgi:hypothetical protein